MEQSVGSPTDAAASPPARRVKRRWFRFSLQTLVIFVLLIGSGMGLWWKWEPWVVVQVLNGHTNIVRSVCFSADGGSILTASWDRTARIWDLQNKKQPIVLRGHKNIVEEAAYTPDGGRIITSGDDDTRIWSAKGELQSVLSGDGSPISCTPDGTLTLTSSGGALKLWDVETGAKVSAFAARNPYTARFSPDGDRIVVASDDYTASIWDPASGMELGVLKGHRDPRLRDAYFSPDGRAIVTFCDDNALRLWDARTFTLRWELKSKDGFCNAHFVCGSSLLVVVGHDKLYLCDIVKTEAQSIHLTAGIFRSALSADGARLLTLGADEALRVWDARNLSGLYRKRLQRPYQCAFAPDSRRFAIGHEDGHVEIWSRRRPEYWWGLAWLPEFWLTVVFAAAFLWSVWRDRRTP